MTKNCKMKSINHFLVDIDSRATLAMTALRTLKSTVGFSNHGKYWHEPAWTRIEIQTTMTMEELDAWFYNRKDPQVGCVEGYVMLASDHPDIKLKLEPIK